MDLAGYRNSAALRLGLDSNTAASEEQLFVDEQVYQGILEVLRRTRCYTIPALMTLSTDVGDYEMDEDVLAVSDLTVVGSTSPIDRLTADEILRLRRGSTAASVPVRFFAMNAQILMVYPNPPATPATQIEVYYTPRPARMPNASSTPSNVDYGGIPEEAHRVVEWYMLREGADLDDDASSKIGEKYDTLYERELNRFRRSLERIGGRKRSRYKPAGALAVSSANDVY